MFTICNANVVPSLRVGNSLNIVPSFKITLKSDYYISFMNCTKGKTYQRVLDLTFL